MSKNKKIAEELLAWYDKSRRVLPWRAPPGKKAEPYHVWLSEIMLQQTTVKTVGPYFGRFLKAWPRVTDLAAAEEETVLAAWAGLGYYNRARNLHKAAKVVAEQMNGCFPDNEKDLLELPGVGAYTAAAIAAIAFDEAATVVDGNVERVVTRLFAVRTPMPKSKPILKKLASTLTPTDRAGDFAQAMMDLGATLCSPKRPSCLLCPINKACEAHAKGIAGTLPLRTPKTEKPTRYGAAFLAFREDDFVLLRKRPSKGLLASMIEVPGTEWGDAMPSPSMAKRQAPLKAKWMALRETVTHTFTHFHLELTIYCATVPSNTKLNAAADPARCRWVASSELTEQALPSVMRKVLRHGITETV